MFCYRSHVSDQFQRTRTLNYIKPIFDSTAVNRSWHLFMLYSCHSLCLRHNVYIWYISLRVRARGWQCECIYLRIHRKIHMLFTVTLKMISSETEMSLCHFIITYNSYKEKLFNVHYLLKLRRSLVHLVSRNVDLW